MNTIQMARPFLWQLIIFTLCCMTPVIAQQTELDSVSHCEEYIMVDNEVDGSIPLPHFDETLGRLVGAVIDVEMLTDHTLGVENTSQGEVNVSFNIICLGNITAPLQGSPTALETGISVEEMTLATFDGTFDFDGPSGNFFDELHGSGGLFKTNVAAFTYSGSDLNFFPGTGTYDLPLDAETSFDVIGGGGNAQVEITTDGVMNACVKYYYIKEADLSLIKTLNSNTPTVGDTISFTLSITNDGPTATTNVLVDDALPAELEFVSSSPDDFNPVTNTWTVGDLNIDETKELTLLAKILTGGETTIINTAQVSASDIPDPDSTPSNDDPDEDDQDEAEFYVYRLGVIGDYVWYDEDRGLDQDASETGVENMTVYLYDELNNLLATTQTNGSG